MGAAHDALDTLDGIGRWLRRRAERRAANGSKASARALDQVKRARSVLGGIVSQDAATLEQLEREAPWLFGAVAPEAPAVVLTDGSDVDTARDD
jgi:hypothetical protein